MSAVGDAAGDGNVFMIMSKCQSVISSSSRDLRDTVPTRDSRRDLNEILTVSTSNMHPSSSPSSLRGDRRVHRVPDLPREEKNLHVLFAFLNTRLLRAPRGQKQVHPSALHPRLPM